MAIVSGSFTTDWSSVSLVPADLDSMFEDLVDEVNRIATDLDNGSFTGIQIPGGVSITFNGLAAGGTATATGSGLTGNSPVLTSLTYLRGGIGLTVKGAADGIGNDSFTEASVTIGGVSATFKGAITYNNNTDALSGTISEVSQTVAGYTVTLKGASTLSGTADNITLGGTMTSVTVSGAGGSFTLTGTSLAANSLESAISVQDILNLALTGNDSITGGTGNDTLNGSTGNDTLNGGLGTDSLLGGVGNDTYIDAHGVDAFVELENEGADTVNAAVNHTLAAHIENLLITVTTAVNGTGNGLANSLTGAAGNNVLSGLAGNDTLRGLAGNDTLIGGEGNDLLDGGLGNDTFSIDSSDLALVDAGGIDTVESDFNYTLASFLENLILTGEATSGTGNALANDLTANAALASTLTGLAGNDRYFVFRAEDSVVEALNGGTDTVMAQLAASEGITLAANVENLTLLGGEGYAGTGNELANSMLGSSGVDDLAGAGGNDTLAGGAGNDGLLGEAGNDSLRGDAGNDTLDGGLGNDAMAGGDGNDFYSVAVAGDTVSETNTVIGVGGDDTIESAVNNFVLGANVEHLILAGAALNGSGNTLANSLRGNTLNNSLNGGGGADTYIGSAGNDTYVITEAGDTVAGGDDEGMDTVQVGQLAKDAGLLDLSDNAEIENATFTGTTAAILIGNASDNVLTGGSGADALTGSGGNDTLNGGLGNDVMTGGADDDVYVVNAAADQVIEAADAGTDRIEAAITYTLAANLEDLALTGTAAIHGTGNDEENVLTGNSGANSLNGMAGADLMRGLGGADTYFVDDLGDVAEESIAGAAGGVDVVRSSVDFTLGANLEQLVLLGVTGRAGTGNGIANTITGTTGNDTLDGGLGNDAMAGGAGNDKYFVSNSTLDVVTELATAGSGTDTVESTASYTLALNVEHLILAGTDNINGTGNAGLNSITGNAGNNSLFGGLGADTYVGSGGNDTYLVEIGDSVDAIGGDDGFDTVVTSLAGSAFLDLSDDLLLEGVTWTGAAGASLVGHDGDNALVGGAGKDTLVGGNGNNTLNGGGGADSMTGGTGNDTYFVDSAQDTITADPGGDSDTVAVSFGTFTSGGGIENITLLGTATNATGDNATNNLIIGNAGANSLNGMAGADTLKGLGGNDTYFVDDLGDAVEESIAGAAGGTDLVRSTVDFTLGANIENLLLLGIGEGFSGVGNTLNNAITASAFTDAGGGDNLYGLEGNDTLLGGAQDDLLDGGLGNDSMVGGLGNDLYIVTHSTLDVVSETNTLIGAGGNDTVDSTVSYALGANVENLVLSGGGNINGTGNGLNNRIAGNTGSNSLNGGLGNDTYVGSDGDDIYVLAQLGDTIDFTPLQDADTDTVQISVLGHALLDISGVVQLENVTFNGTGNSAITGNDGNNVLIGSTGNDVITGNDGNDSLVGNAGRDSLVGGAGNDTLVGGVGNDTYDGGMDDDTYFVEAGDTVNADTGGVDTIITSLAVAALAAGIENVVLQGAAAANVTGNAENNSLTGNTGNNSLAGGEGNDILIGNAGNDTLNGGTGVDQMTGGDGNDTYDVDESTDVVTETNSLAGGGIADVVRSETSYTLGANVEQLQLLTAISWNGTGNNLNNLITGNVGSNLLSGDAGNDTLLGGGGSDTLNGGLGNDSMVGGDSDDYYFVNHATLDIVSETVATIGGGVDTVETTVTYTLGANVENLMLSDEAGNINGTGNGLNNLIIGSEGNNSIVGAAGNDTLDGGSDGTDTLVGGAGNDTYVYGTGDTITEAAGVAGGVDTVTSAVESVASLAANVENIALTSGSHIDAVGNTLNNIITGNTGNNSLDGGAGNDTLNGGAGNDMLDGGAGNDSISGGADEDTVFYDGEAGDFTISAVTGGYNVSNGVATDFVSNDVELVKFGAADAVDIGDAAGMPDIPAPSPELEAAIASGSYWNEIDGDPVVVTYSFFNATTAAAGGDDVINPEANVGFMTPNSAYIAAVNSVLAFFESISLVDFQFAPVDSSDVMLRFGLNNQLPEGGPGLAGYAFFPEDYTDFGVDGGGLESEVWLNTESFNFDLDAAKDFVQGTATYETLLHEVGHAMGLKHSFSGDPILPPEYESTLHTVMSYTTILQSVVFQENGNDGLQQGEGFSYGQIVARSWTLAPLDIGTIQILYGVNDNTAAGDDTYDFAVLEDTAAYMSLWDGGGNDTIDLTDFDAGRPSYVDLSGFSFSSIGYGVLGTHNSIFGVLPEWGYDPAHIGIFFYDGTNNVAILPQSQIENVLGGPGDDEFVGNETYNLLEGNAGNDTLDGGAAIDTMIGGAGNDILVVDSLLDVATEAASGGTEDVLVVQYTVDDGTYTVSASMTIEGKVYANFEGLIIEGEGLVNITGTSGNNALGGNGSGNVLTGLAGNDTLDGGGGVDTMIGGGGNDIYFLDVSTDTITEGVSEGAADFVVVGFTGIALGAAGQYQHIENLALSGDGNFSATGSSGDNDLFGNIGNNTLSGAGGLDFIFGGVGNDVIDGGLGNDDLFGEHGNDTLTGGGGADRFWFDTLPDPLNQDGSAPELIDQQNVDTIFDFNSTEGDEIVLHQDTYTVFYSNSGDVVEGSFVEGSNPVAANAFGALLYDTDNGNLYFDDDGNGAGDPVLFAVLQGVPELAITDFVSVAFA